jgi:hypothetical protein
MQPGQRSASGRRLIDVSHVVEHGMITYKGFPAPIICDWLSREASRAKYAHGTEFQIGKIEMIANTGTYVDSPFHRYENGKDLSELPLESVADLECHVVRVDPATGPAIDAVPLTASEVGGRAVLFHTGWDRHWRTDAYFDGHPYLTERGTDLAGPAGFLSFIPMELRHGDAREEHDLPLVRPRRRRRRTLLRADVPRFVRDRGAPRTGRLSVRTEGGRVDGRVHRPRHSVPRTQRRTGVPAQRSVLVSGGDRRPGRD